MSIIIYNWVQSVLRNAVEAACGGPPCIPESPRRSSLESRSRQFSKKKKMTGLAGLTTLILVAVALLVVPWVIHSIDSIDVRSIQALASPPLPPFFFFLSPSIIALVSY